MWPLVIDSDIYQMCTCLKSRLAVCALILCEYEKLFPSLGYSIIKQSQFPCGIHVNYEATVKSGLSKHTRQIISTKKYEGDNEVRKSATRQCGKTHKSLPEVCHHVLVKGRLGHYAHRAMFLMGNWWLPEVICADVTGY